MLESTGLNFRNMITGQATRVESGIEVNGFVTDKYELSGENLVEDGDESASAFVYVARDGGFITLFEAQGQISRLSLGLIPINLQTLHLHSTLSLWRMARLILSFLPNATSRLGG